MPSAFGRIWGLLRNDRGGAAAVEFGFAALAFLVFLMGTMEVGRAIWTSTALQFAVEQASRLVIANPTATDSEIKAYVVQHLASVYSEHVHVSTEREKVSGVEFLSIVGSYDFYPIWITTGGGWFTLKGRSRIPLST